MKELFDAARKGDTGFIRKQIEDRPALADIREAETGRTMLHVAAEHNNALSTYVLIVDGKASPHIKDEAGHRPIDLAARHGGPQVTQLLHEATHAEVLLRLRESGRQTDAGLLPDETLQRLAEQNGRSKNDPSHGL
ncbi:MAG: ankyrin repeat domain-containing protein [Parvularcula sp.]|jgi:ankyrin repeat protein|nr:ankyrin repeat domain-containing protein [Parvularcula sp.]